MMSMVARKLFTPGKTVVAALLVGLLGQQAAADEIVVYGRAASVGVGVDERALRTEVETYIRSIDRELKAALAETLRRGSEPKLEVASATEPAQG